MQPADRSLIETVGLFGVIRADQLTRLSYAKSSLSYVQKRLKALVEAGILVRGRVPGRLAAGSTPYYYSLSQAGARLVSGVLPVRLRRKPVELANRSGLFLEHTLLTNDLLITLLRTQGDDLRVERIETEWMLKEKLGRFVPDGFLSIVKDDFRYPLFIEVDRGSEQRVAWSEKIERLVSWYPQALETLGVNQFSLVIVIAGGSANRLENLVSWTASELDRLGEPDLGSVIFLTAEPVMSARLVADPVWVQPFGQGKLVTLWEDDA